MIHRILVSTAIACLLATPCPALAQTANSDVTFRVPLNLTLIPADIAKVAVDCRIASEVGQVRDYAANVKEKRLEFPVSGGQVVTTASVVVAVSSTDAGLLAGKSSQYTCVLEGFSTSLQRWDYFDAAQTVVAFRLSPTPAPIVGTLVW